MVWIPTSIYNVFQRLIFTLALIAFTQNQYSIRHQANKSCWFLETESFSNTQEKCYKNIQQPIHIVEALVNLCKNIFIRFNMNAFESEMMGLWLVIMPVSWWTYSFVLVCAEWIPPILFGWNHLHVYVIICIFGGLFHKLLPIWYNLLFIFIWSVINLLGQSN